MAYQTDTSITSSTPASNARIIYLLCFLLFCWISVLIIESTRPSLQFLEFFPHLDKIAHLGAYSILGVLVCGLSHQLNQKPSIVKNLIPLFVVTMCGVLEESLQLFTPGRTCTILDLLADIVGGIGAVVLFNRLKNVSKLVAILNNQTI